VFRWCPGSGCRFRKTEICQTCAKLKNVCQSCIFDLEYGLPVGVRDAVLGVQEKVPQAEVNRDYFMAVNANRLAKGELGLIDYSKVDPANKAILEELSKKMKSKQSGDPELEAASDVIIKRNLPPVCSFYAKGACTRGDLCPFRHELSTEKPPSLKSFRERYYGQDDPMAKKMLEKLPELASSTHATTMKPADKTIKAFFISGIRDGLDEEAIRMHFGAYGDIKAVKLNGSSGIVDFTTRLAAETAAEHCIGLISINGVDIKAAWAKAKVTPAPPTEAHPETKSTEQTEPTAKRRPPPPPKSSRSKKE
jgi:pre-mRNA-splicing factor RBM22/SLT11